jgi:hypothetical protein
MTRTTPLTAAQQAEARSHANLSLGSGKMVKKARLNNTKLPHLIRAFIEGATATQAAEASGLSKQVVNRFIASLRRVRPYQLHISDYHIVPGWILPVYTLGYDKDVPIPKSLSQAERSKRYRARQKHLKLIQATAGSSTHGS